jgi:hypothetical protein
MLTLTKLGLDKVSIQYTYQHNSKGADEAVALDKILTDATNKGLTFISDRDAQIREDCIQVLTYGIQVLMLYLN